MNDFHCNYIKKKYGSKAKLLMTDTDSFVYEIKTEDFFKDISGDVRENSIQQTSHKTIHQEY